MDGKAVDTPEQVFGAAIAVHRALGPGLLESTYEACLAFKLVDRGLAIVRPVALPVVYRGVRIDCGYRLDLVVEGRVTVDIEAVERTLPVHEAQVLTHLESSELPVARLLNFNVPLLRTESSASSGTRRPGPASLLSASSARSVVTFPATSASVLRPSLTTLLGEPV